MMPPPPMSVIPTQVQPEYFTLQQRKPAAEPVQPETTGTHAPASTGAKFGDSMMLETLLPEGRQRKHRGREDQSRKIFVGGLNPTTTSEALRKHFEPYGTVTEGTVVIDRVTQKSRGFGFVVFEDGIPEGLLQMKHIIDSRRCGVRDYGEPSS
jgi:hypothetical protein